MYPLRVSVSDVDAGPVQGPLRHLTPPAWVASATADLPAFLNDHAHLERKAASNALELLHRWPWPVTVRGESARQAGADRWSRLLASIARDEAAHLAQVLRLLTAHGGHFERSHVNAYAAALRQSVRKGHGTSELVDRLLVSALIEARSGERFRLLAAHVSQPDLRRFYASLVASEEGHYRAFLDLAKLLPEGRESVDERWDELLDVEASTIASMPAGPTMHSGYGA
jgi:tRNA-(ms[2]io[6]A)-hydroxylase